MTQYSLSFSELNHLLTPPPFNPLTDILPSSIGWSFWSSLPKNDLIPIRLDLLGSSSSSFSMYDTAPPKSPLQGQMRSRGQCHRSWVNWKLVCTLWLQVLHDEHMFMKLIEFTYNWNIWLNKDVTYIKLLLKSTTTHKCHQITNYILF